MIKISALNKESEEDSDSEVEVTKEALEQIALQQYAKALEVQRKGNLSDATQLLKDLLETELLDEVKKPEQGAQSGPLLNLKYLCYKNLASMLSLAGDIEGAIEAYFTASELDDTDVTLWHRLGTLCLQAKQYESALHAFQRGVERNPKHWLCLDNLVTLLLGLDYKEECICTIYDALQLDPGYLRGLAYRKHIFTEYRYIRDYMEYTNSIYKWNEHDDEPIDEIKAAKLIKEAEKIHETFLEQQRALAFKCVLPELKMKKPITELSWYSVGESLVYMHHYMTENCFSHACFLEIVFEKHDSAEPMEVSEESPEVDSDENKPEENVEKVVEISSENENNDLSDKEKAQVETDKGSDVEAMQVDPASEAPPEPKTQKKGTGRRRCSDLSFLQQWEWCNKRRSGRKKPANKQDRLDENIYETLRRMVPVCLAPDIVEKKENKARESSPDVTDIDKLFEEKPTSDNKDQYFGTELEQKDVKEFINKYTESKKDIIDLLKDYLNILAAKWRVKWPENLTKLYIEANKCYSTHIDVPSCTDDYKDDVVEYTARNMLVEEFSVNNKLGLDIEEKDGTLYDSSVMESISLMISMKPHFFDGINCLELTLRHLWLKLHIHILNKCEGSALDCLYELSYEFDAMGEYHDSYSLNIVNFTFKPVINETEIFAYIKFLERNRKLSTVQELYERGHYDEVLTILLDSFEHCQNMDKKQEEEMSLDFAVQLTIILDCYWALENIDLCFKWSLTCLHEALKHYFRHTSGTSDYEKWTKAVVKILCSMEHMLSTEGLSCMEILSQKELSQVLDDLIRIIGHQVETKANYMPFETVLPWIIMHYILQREEDQGRSRTLDDKDKSADDIPNPLMLLFIAHEHLGNRGWCAKNDSKLLFFTLDTVVPLLRSPALAKCLEQVCQHLEQCVYCLYGHPGKKNKVKYLTDHNVTTYPLDWNRAQHLYEIFRPPELPALEGKVSGISADTEQLFRQILDCMPTDHNINKYVPELEKYIKGLVDKLPYAPVILPFKMRDIYFLLGDYYFKKEEREMSNQYNMLDIVINRDRFESWAQLTLNKAVNLEGKLNTCKNLDNEKDYLKPSKVVIRCFQRSLELDPSHCNMWIEYGMFVYTIHSFCSRLLKQASESLSMEDFESLEKRKEDMLDVTQKCFTKFLGDLNSSNDNDKSNDEKWLQYYMLGKVAEKKNKTPSVYLNYYMQAVKSLEEADATYPAKINYSSPTHLCIEVLEIHYRIHASILKYIEQHENKPIPTSVGKVFMTCLEDWQNGPFMKKSKKDVENTVETTETKTNGEPVQAANILKRSISDAGEEDTHEAKKLKLEAAAAKVRRSASYDTERIVNKETQQLTTDDNVTVDSQKTISKDITTTTIENDKGDKPAFSNDTNKVSDVEKASLIPTNDDKAVKPPGLIRADKKEETSSTSSSSSDSSTSDSSSDSTTDSSRDSDTSNKSNDAKPLTEEEIMKIIGACLDALEDCANRIPPHYKAIYRIAHYHFYYKKGKDIERCRDLMLSTFVSRAGLKLGGLFSERKASNFFNNIWKIPSQEVDRPGSFAFHMNRSVLLTMEILKEIDDHKTLLELSLHLQRVPEPDKKYLRDSDREELSQQAFSLCVQSLKGQLLKFSQQEDLKSNEIEQEALKSLMLDIYRAYQKVQKQSSSKQFTNLLIEAYKLVMTTPANENTNFVDLSMKYCQSLIQRLKQQATQASLGKTHNMQKKHAPKVTESVKPVPPPVSTTVNPSAASHTGPKPDPREAATKSTNIMNMTPLEIAAAFQSYLPMLNDPILTQQTNAALSLSYLNSHVSALAGYTSLQNSIQSSLQNTFQNSFQAEYYRQCLGQSFSSAFNLPPPKKKRGPKPQNVNRSNQPATSQMKNSKSFSSNSGSSTAKAAPTPVITSLQKSLSTPLTASMGSVLSTLPASLTANLTSSYAGHSATHSLPASRFSGSNSTSKASGSSKPTIPQSNSSAKTLQEKLAERQKSMPKPATDISNSISRLPPSLTITKTGSTKPVQGKKTDVRKPHESETRAAPKPISSDEIIILDDD